MRTLLDLSNELLYRVVKAVPGDDLPSLSLTSKLLHALSDKDCKRHLVLKRYSTLSFGSYQAFDAVHQSPTSKSHGDTKDAILFLESIMKDSRIREFPQRLCVGGGCIDEDDPTYWGIFADEAAPLYHDQRQSIITQRSAQLKTMIENCDFIHGEDKGKASVAILNPKYEGLAVSLIVTMLPELRSIVTQDLSHGTAGKRLCAMIVKIAEANQDPKSPNHNKALSQLQEFSMSHIEFDGSGESISSYASFAMLPSMRILSGTQIAGHGDLEWPSSFLPGSSNVTEINFGSSALDAQAFESLLSGISTLKKFKYHHHGAMGGFAEYNATEYVNSLRRHAVSSLQLLDISVEDIDELIDDEEDQQRVGSLQMFKSLENVRLDYTAFQIVGPNDGLDGGALEGRGLYSEEEEERTESMERLVDFLPASIKSLTVINFKETMEVQELFRGMAEEVSEKLPVFKAVTFEGVDPLDGGMKTALAHAGLGLKRWTGISHIDL